ncbi:MAG: protein translocase subunit SecDF [Crocinitomicaceae bacterium]|nr:protein translocase subunit SecDF [Crocinitomicaceae bacterium]
MQNKSAIWFFTILLTLVCLYQISFTFVAYGVENDVETQATQKADSLAQATSLDSYQVDSARQAYENEILLNTGAKEVYPLFGYTYDYVKRRKINLGLDLQGGMNVTLEVSVIDMLKAKAGSNAKRPEFIAAIDRAKELQKESSDGFVTLFGRAWSEVNPDKKMASVFSTLNNKDIISADATDDEIIDILNKEAQEAIINTEQVLRKRVDNLGVVQPKIQRLSNSGRIIVELPGIKDKPRAKKILQATAQLQFWETYNYQTDIYGAFAEANDMLASKVEVAADDEVSEEENALSAIENSGAEVDTTAKEDLPQSADQDTSGVEDEFSELLDDDSSAVADTTQMSREEMRKANPLFSLLDIPREQDASGQVMPARGPVAGYALTKDTAQIGEYLRRKDVRKIIKASAPRVKFLWGAKPQVGTNNVEFYTLYAIKVPKDGNAPLEGDKITNANVDADDFGQPAVSLSMNTTGAKAWRELTRKLAEQGASGQKGYIAIVLDNHVYSAPGVDEEIPTGNTRISGSFTLEEASDLAGVLSAGKLPAPSNIIEEAVVGPSLGQEAIDDGLSSFLIALAVILIYMIFYYNRAGIVADIALIANLFFVIGVLTSLKATLTLPGIAGIVLTIGMSVDANVLVYERIREELQAGKGLKLAIEHAYGKNGAMPSIIDANITTLLTGIILLVFGTGPIQGFATTLIIGILTSLFSAIFVTRLLFELNLEKSKKISFSTKMTENVLKNAKYAFVGKRKLFYGVSGVLIVISLASLFTKGLDFGVDFKGGRTYQIRFENAVQPDAVRDALANVFIDEDGTKQTPEVKAFGASNQVLVTTKYMIDSDQENSDEIVEGKINDGLKVVGDNFEIMRSQKVEATIADDIKTDAIWAVLFSLVVIFIYILIRFKKYQYSLGAVIAMTHDVLIVLGIFSLAYGILPFSLEIDQAFIAAILTVVGYSINDTVVVFDRIREYLGIHKNTGYDEVVNKALNSTLSRTINTSLSTFFVLLMIFIFGGEVIRGFVFALMVGVVVGTYSSICVATPIMIDLQSKKDKELKH